jgi:hypothetical protein
MSRAVSALEWPRVYWSEGIKFDTTSTVAWRVNLLCAVFGSLAAAIIAQTVVDILGKSHPYSFPAAIISAGVFAFSPLVWEYSIGGEVFSLNNFICSILLWLSVRLALLRDACRGRGAGAGDQSTREAKRLLCLGALFVGFALSNQHSSLLLVVCVVPAMALLHYELVANVRFFAQLCLCGVIGLSPYLYLYFAAAVQKPGSWGDTSSLSGLFRHVVRAEYGTFQLGIIEGAEGALARIGLYLKHASQESYHTLLPLLACFFAYMWRDYSRSRISSSRPPARASKPKRADPKRDPLHEKQAQLMQEEAVEDSAGSAARLAARLVVAGAWAGYVLLWHGVFSNLPLDSPMPFAVHSR